MHKVNNEDGGDYIISKAQLALSLSSLLKQVKVNTDYDIPYLAGFNKDGTICYIDHNLPQVLIIKGKPVNVHKFIILHEAIEKAIMDRYKLHYEMAHRIATEAEKAAVEMYRINWEAYNNKLDKYLDYSHGEDMKSIPADLDLKPYKDSQDKQTLAAIKEILKK